MLDFAASATLQQQFSPMQQKQEYSPTTEKLTMMKK
jgi:hypothetical protein